MKFRNHSVIALAALCLASTGCSSDPDENTDVAGGNLEIFSWWTSGGEQDALNAMLDVHRERVPDANVTNAAIDYADEARAQLAQRMNDGLPPDTFQANIGADLFQWVLFNGNNDSESKVHDLNYLADANGWLFDDDVLAAASYNGKLYGVPVNVHRINSLFIRKDLFDQYELEIPTTFQELTDLCADIMANAELQAESPDGRMACLGLGNKWNWTLSLMAFEMVLPSIAGGDYYQSFWSGNESATDQQVQDTLDAMLHLYCGGTDTSNCLETTYFNRDVDDADWDAGVGKLAEKRAMMAPMGDWAKGYLESDAGGNLRPGIDFVVVPFPGSDSFVFTSDMFPLPKGAPNRAGAEALLTTFGSIEGQIAFNELKGSIPARIDVDPTEFDEVTQQTISDFDTQPKAPALSGLVPGSVMPDLAVELKAAMQAGSTTTVEAYLNGNYSALQ